MRKVDGVIYFTVPEAARILGEQNDVVRNWVIRREIEWRKFENRRVYIADTEIAKKVAELTTR